MAGFLLLVTAWYARQSFVQAKRQAKAAEDQVTELKGQGTAQREALTDQLTEARRQADAAEKQSDELKSQGELQRKALDEQINTARRQAEAAEAQRRHAVEELAEAKKTAAAERRARALQVRPTLTLVNWAIHDFASEDYLNLQLHIRNDGQFPARELEPHAMLVLDETGHAYVAIPTDEKKQSDRKRVIAPQEANEFMLRFPKDLLEANVEYAAEIRLTISWVDPSDIPIDQNWSLPFRFFKATDRGRGSLRYGEAMLKAIKARDIDPNEPPTTLTTPNA